MSLTPEEQSDRHSSSVLPMVATLGVILILAFSAGAVIRHRNPPVPHAGETPIVLQDVQGSPLVAELKSRRIITEVEEFDGGYAVMVGDGFFLADYRTKVAAMSALSTLFDKRRGGDGFVLYDFRTNKKVGYYSADNGLDVY